MNLDLLNSKLTQLTNLGVINKFNLVGHLCTRTFNKLFHTLIGALLPNTRLA